MLDLGLSRTKSEDGTSHSVDSPRRLLTLGRVDQVRVQVGFRTTPEDRPYQQFLLDLPVSEGASVRKHDAFDEELALAALEPVLFAGAEAPRHYSLHQHRWHTSWGASPGVLDIGIWECGPGEFTATHDDDTEVCQILSGSATVTGEDGTSARVSAGSLLVLPVGWRGRWMVHETIRKTYVVLKAP